MFCHYKQKDTKSTHFGFTAVIVFSICVFFSPAVGAEQPETLLTNIIGYQYLSSESPDSVEKSHITAAPRDGYWKQFAALLISSDGRIKNIYDTPPKLDDLRQFKDNLEIVDGQGKFVLPGLIDSHGHVLSLGQRHQRVDLVGSNSVVDAQQRIEKFIANDTTSAWILGRGWNQVLWPSKQFPKASDIDEIESKRPVYLGRIDGHAAWANTAALKAAGINEYTKDPQGGQILKDANGQPTGVLIDNAMDLVTKVIPSPSLESVKEALQFAQSELAEMGITSVHDAGVDFELAQLYRQLANKNALTTRIYGMVSGAGEALTAVGKPWPSTDNDLFSLTSVKLYADGALGSRGAAMIEPYSDQENHFGLLFSPYDDLKLQVARATKMGFQVNVHAIGDAANRQVLDIFEQLPNNDRRNRIEHAQIITLDDLQRFADLNVIAAMQPVHATSDMNMAEDRIGSERIAGAYAWRRLMDYGVVIAAGSDFPVELSNPFHGLYAAVARQDHDGEPRDGWYADQSMNRAEALRAFTVDAAYAAHQEDRLGNLLPGHWADFIVLDQDFFDVEVEDLWQLKVSETWLAGKRIYKQNKTPEKR